MRNSNLLLLFLTTLYAASSSKIPLPEQISLKLYQYAHFLSPAYCPDNLPSWTCKPCLSPYAQNTTSIKLLGDFESSAFGYIASNERLNLIIISFRGTLSVDNFVSDLLVVKPPSIFPFPYPGDDDGYRNSTVPENVRVHFGFWKEWRRIRDQTLLELSIRRVRMKFDTKVLVTGHSLGAAIATLAALDIATLPTDNPSYINSSKIELITAGEPRVGNVEFAKWADSIQFSDRFRVVQKSDLIPHLPPNAAFTHRAREVWIDSNSAETWLCDSDEEEDGRFVMQKSIRRAKRTNIENRDCANSVFPFLYNMVDHLRVWDLRLGLQECIL